MAGRCRHFRPSQVKLLYLRQRPRRKIVRGLGTRQIIQHFPSLLERFHFPARAHTLSHFGREELLLTIGQLAIEVGNEVRAIDLA